MEQNSHPINKILEESLSKVKTIIDVDTVVGSTIVCADGINIIPITKVSVGFIAGGGEYSQNIPPKKQKKDYPFAGGTGTGFSITPIGFLIGKEENLKFVPVDAKNSIEKIANILKDLIKNISSKK